MHRIAPIVANYVVTSSLCSTVIFLSFRIPWSNLSYHPVVSLPLPVDYPEFLSFRTPTPTARLPNFPIGFPVILSYYMDLHLDDIERVEELGDDASSDTSPPQPYVDQSRSHSIQLRRRKAETRSVCQYCKKSMTTRVLPRHMRTVHKQALRIHCPYLQCSETFSRKDALGRHVGQKHEDQNKPVPCENCGKFISPRAMKDHRKRGNCNKKTTARSPEIKMKDVAVYARSAVVMKNTNVEAYILGSQVPKRTNVKIMDLKDYISGNQISHNTNVKAYTFSTFALEDIYGMVCSHTLPPQLRSWLVHDPFIMGAFLARLMMERWVAAGKPIALVKRHSTPDRQSEDDHSDHKEEPRMPLSSVADFWWLHDLVVKQTNRLIDLEMTRCQCQSTPTPCPQLENILLLLLFLRACDRLVFGSDSPTVKLHEQELVKRQPRTEYYEKLSYLLTRVFRGTQGLDSKPSWLITRLILCNDAYSLPMIGWRSYPIRWKSWLKNRWKLPHAKISEIWFNRTMVRCYGSENDPVDIRVLEPPKLAS